MPLAKIDCSEISIGVCFSAPVFFDDGINMFLAANHPAKAYHVQALKRWAVPFLITAGKKTDLKEDEEALEVLDLEEADDMEELEELEELEEV